MRRVMLWKKRGETPLAALTAWKQANPRYVDTPATYAGRLDPMAEGKLLILLGDECKKREQYLRLDKAYEIEVLFDIGSDTADALGVVSYANKKTVSARRILEQALRQELGTHARAYPRFSSKTVNGKPLFLHTLEGTLADANIPTHEETIYRIDLKNVRMISSAELHDYIATFLDQVPRVDESSKQLGADFRIAEVRASWDAAFMAAGDRSFMLVKLKVSCASGTYMRSLAERLGATLGTYAIALSITRTRIGKRLFGMWLPFI